MIRTTAAFASWAFLLAIPAAAVDVEKIEKDVERLEKFFGLDKMEEKWTREKLDDLANARDPKERAEAAEWLGGRRDPQIAAALGRALSDRDAKVRYAAARGLWKAEKAAEAARDDLVRALEDPDPNVVAQVAGALQMIGMKEAELVAPRKRVFASAQSSLDSRFIVARNLVGHEPSVRLLETMLAYLEKNAVPRASDPHGAARHNVELAEKALARLAKTQDRALLPTLMDATRTARAGQVVMLKTVRLFEPRPDGYTEFVLGFLSSADPRVRYEALYMLRDLKKEKDVKAWAARAAAMIGDPDASVRSEALWALAAAGGLAAGEIEAVVRALGDPDKSVRRSAARTIGEIGEWRQPMPAAAKARVNELGRPALTAAMEKDPDSDVRSEAQRALRNLGDDKTATRVAAAKPADPRTEASGMAVLRERKVSFEESSFFRALSEADVDLVRAFLDAGMPTNAPVAGLGPPLRAALFSSRLCNPTVRPTRAETKALVRLLLDRGADPNGADENGNTPLMMAASNGCDRELMRMLIKAGARIHAQNKMGLTPFEFGMVYGHDGLEEIIAAGYRMPPDKAKMYIDAYAGRPAAQAMIRKASSQPAPRK